MKLLYILNIPSPYRVAYFEELGKYCDLTVLFEKAASDERDPLWADYSFKNFKGIILEGKKVGTDKSFCPSVVRYLKKGKYSAVVCADFVFPTGMLAIEYMRAKHIPYYLEADGAFAGNGKGIKERIKKHFICGAVGYFSTADETDKYFLTYGAKKEQLVRYPFTSIYEKDIYPAIASKEEKAALRRKWNVSENRVVMAVGQFIPRKGFDILIRAAKLLEEDVGIYFVGGVPTEKYRSMVKENKDIGAKIHFVGFKNKNDLKEYYRLSDVFCLPTREDIWGLVVNEAMACGLPVVTTNRCIAGLELIKNGENGEIVETENVGELHSAIDTILADPMLQMKEANASLQKIRKYTLENMAKAHLNGFGIENYCCDS